MSTSPASPPAALLRRHVGLGGAVLLGLGSMVGTGVFVGIALAAGIVGSASWLVAAIAVAALLASCSASSSARLAARFPVSGGTYEYAHRVLTPATGFAAGWLFVVAKCASAGAAALGVSVYALGLADLPTEWARWVALVLVALVTILVAGGIQRTNAMNAVLVAITLGGLGALVFASLSNGGPWPGESRAYRLTRGEFLEAAALLYVAFTGFGRLATLGEEVNEPKSTIPRAITTTMIAVTTLYIAVALAATRQIDPAELGALAAGSHAPLEEVARRTGHAWLAPIVALAAATAMAGVLLNLVLGVSRVVLAMARRGDVPPALAHLDACCGAPRAAVWATGALIALPVLLGNVGLAWSLSAFAVLLYYAITNLAALSLPNREEPRALGDSVSALGMFACLGLAWWVEWWAWAAGLALLAMGFCLRALCHRFFKR